VNGEVLEARETKGVCLGFAILKTKMANGPKKVLETLFEEAEDLDFPPVVILLRIDGTLFFFKFYEGDWAELKSQLLNEPKPLPPSIPLVKKAQPAPAVNPKPVIPFS
jgi:hypothetical protein